MREKFPPAAAAAAAALFRPEAAAAAAAAAAPANYTFISLLVPSQACQSDDRASCVPDRSEFWMHTLPADLVDTCYHQWTYV